MVRMKMKRLFLLMVFLIVTVLYNWSQEPFQNGGPRSLCRLRDLDPWDESFVSELSSDKQIECSTQHPFMYVNDTGFILFDKTALKGHSTRKLICSFQSVFRDGDKEISLGEATVFYPPTFIKSQTFIVECKNMTGVILYKHVHVNMAYNESSEREKQIKPETSDKLSIIIIAFDSMSRSQARRGINRSLSYMTDTLGAYDFTGYNVVGENTFPNMLATLAGIDWRTFYGSSKIDDSFDDLPLFWKNKTGYATFFCENSPHGAIFNYLLKGFQRPPVDYYLRPAFIAMYSNPPFIYDDLEDSYHCYGNQLYFDIQLGYFKRFLTKYTRRQKVALFWNTDIGHYSLRYAKNADEPLLNFLHWLKSGGHLDNAVLMLISDHGFRIGGASKTPIGRLESTNPIFRLYVPDALKAKHSWLDANIKHNRDKLVTGHDVYFSLLDIMEDEVANARPEDVSFEHLRPRRLFWKIPSDRTCEDAGIPLMFCLRCFQYTNIMESDMQDALILANISVMILNKHLEKFHMCAQLNLTGIKRYDKITNRANQITRRDLLSGLGNNMFSNDIEGWMYLVVYKTTPGHGRYQILMKCDKNTTIEPSFCEPLGMPIRISTYGTQSVCVNEPTLKPYCYCTDESRLTK